MENYINGQPWIQQYGINSAQSGDLGAIGNFTSSAPNFPWAFGISMAATIVAKGYFYLFGGVNSAGSSDRVYRAPIGSGTIGTWEQLSSIPSSLTGYARYGHQAIMLGDKVYLIGGYGCSNVLSATIFSDGSIGTWSAESNLLPSVKYLHSVVVTKNKLYAIGGYTGTWSPTSTIYVASIDPNTGAIGTWSTHSQSLPHTVTEACLSKIGNNVFLIGGKHSDSISGIALKASYSDIDGLLGSWTTVPGVTIPWPTYRASSITVNNCVYYIGGIPNSSDYGTIVKFVYRSVISSGDLTSWASCTNSNTGLSSSSYAVAGDLLVLVGGYTDYGIYDTRTYCRGFYGGASDYAPYDSEIVLPEGYVVSEEATDECSLVSINGVVALNSYEQSDEVSIIANPYIYSDITAECDTDSVETTAYLYNSASIVCEESSDESFSYSVNGYATTADITDEGVIDTGKILATNVTVSIRCDADVDDSFMSATIPNVGSIVCSDNADSCYSSAIASLTPWSVISNETTDSCYSYAYVHIVSSINSVEPTDLVSYQADVPEFVPTTVYAECEADEVICSASQAIYADLVCEESYDSSYSQLIWTPFATVLSDDNADYSSIRAKIIDDWWILHFTRDELICGQQDSQEYDTIAFGRDNSVTGYTPSQPVNPLQFIR